ncbi:hypothetical protein LR48_Vigan03g060900 [Vigna angularis]|uniref:Uncharacterized protein n=1 Tax=Phaseolus angularis TaxID=3914 RepID=A0A0L9U321_PHAAN|nr:hypothetical protein LR48_Vigan03g060900 [Vigna angularis]
MHHLVALDSSSESLVQLHPGCHTNSISQREIALRLRFRFSGEEDRGLADSATTFSVRRRFSAFQKTCLSARKRQRKCSGCWTCTTRVHLLFRINLLHHITGVCFKGEAWRGREHRAGIS